MTIATDQPPEAALPPFHCPDCGKRLFDGAPPAGPTVMACPRCKRKVKFPRDRRP